MDARSHWDGIYRTKAPGEVSWFQERAELSLQFIREAQLPKSARIIDVGGGSSPLVDDLLKDGFQHITVLDVSRTALEAVKARLGPGAAGVTWMEADITRADLASNAYDLWHDRAVFHFLVDADSRRRYVETARRAVKPGGHLIMATFALDGPNECSGLNTMRYDAQGLAREFGGGFQLVESRAETHRTPFGTEQKFVYCHLRRAD